MDIKAKIEKTRSILNNAIESGADYSSILEISKRLDKYIIQYTKDHFCNKKHLGSTSSK